MYVSVRPFVYLTFSYVKIISFLGFFFWATNHELFHHLSIHYEWYFCVFNTACCDVLCNATHYIHIELNVSFQPESYQTRKSFWNFAINYKHKPNIIYWFYQPVLSNCCLDSFSASFFNVFSRLVFTVFKAHFAWCYSDVECFSAFRSRYRSSSTFFPSFLLFCFSYSFVSLFFFYFLTVEFFQEYWKRCNNISNYLPLIETWCNVCFKFFVHQTVSCRLII